MIVILWDCVLTAMEAIQRRENEADDGFIYKIFFISFFSLLYSYIDI